MTRLAAVLVTVMAAALAGRSAPITHSTEPGVSQDTTARLIALGESIYLGKTAKGLCYTCHQPNGKGLKGVAPDLTDGQWLHGDGSVASIMAIIEKGVAKPKDSPVPMPPWGGSKLTPEQLRAVAMYVASLGVAAK